MERYNEYKDSGVQWLGEIPSHWETRPLKYSCSLKGRIGWNGLRSEEFQDTAFAYLVTGQDFIGSEIDWSKCYQISRERYDEDPFIQLNNGDMLITKDGTIGKVAKVTNLDKPACLNSGIFVIKQKGSFFNQGFLYWMLCSNVLKEFNVYTQTGATIAHLYQNVFENMPCLLPPISEQQAIATYLDTVTSKIDEAIAQQQKMIDLLNERKQIIINNAVTKGLNPDAQMKDSGVDWIGEIPEHWIITKLKHLVEITDGTHDTPRYVDPSSNTYPLVTSRCIVNGVIDLSLANHITEQDYNYIATRSYVRRNDVIMPMIGTVGNPAIVDFEDSIAIKNVALFRTNGDINIAKFLKYLLNSTVVKEQFAMYNKGGVQNFVSQEILKNLAIIVPDNITDIVGFLEREIAKIETPIIAHNQQISLLQERKQIIINDVVTGKVKVS